MKYWHIFKYDLLNSHSFFFSLLDPFHSTVCSIFRHTDVWHSHHVLIWGWQIAFLSVILCSLVMRLEMDGESLACRWGGQYPIDHSSGQYGTCSTSWEAKMITDLLWDWSSKPQSTVEADQSSRMQKVFHEKQTYSICGFCQFFTIKICIFKKPFLQS